MRYPDQSKLAFGKKRGCFQLPRDDKTPRKNISCKDILPLIYSEQEMNRDAMRSSNPLDHPDTTSPTRYCLGTGLQMREGKPSHKTVECSYHDVTNAVEGKMLKTMTQEAMQMERKFRTIQQVRSWLLQDLIRSKQTISQNELTHNSVYFIMCYYV